LQVYERIADSVRVYGNDGFIVIIIIIIIIINFLEPSGHFVPVMGLIYLSKENNNHNNNTLDPAHCEAYVT